MDLTTASALTRQHESIATARAPKPYPSINELSQLTPWTKQAIRSKMKRGEFVEGVHFFRVGRQVVFKWTAIVDYIEHREPVSVAAIPLQRSRRHESA